LQVGEPLSGFQGVLSGVPTFTGKTDTLMASPSDVASPVLSSVST
jgi:hypothetical protein